MRARLETQEEAAASLRQVHLALLEYTEEEEIVKKIHGETRFTCYKRKRKEQVAAYMAHYRKSHAQEISAQRARYNAKHRGERREYNVRYYKRHRQVVARQCARYHRDHAEEIARRATDYYQTHKETLLAYSRDYKKSHRRLVAWHEHRRYQTNVEFRLRKCLRARLHVVLRRHLGDPKTVSTVRDLGCAVGELKKYLEERFLPGMSWNNWGNRSGCWSIDHIRPLASFNLVEVAQARQAVHYTNLQPLWHADNMKKGDKVLDA